MCEYHGIKFCKFNGLKPQVTCYYLFLEIFFNKESIAVNLLEVTKKYFKIISHFLAFLWI